MKVRCVAALPTEEQATLLGSYYRSGEQVFHVVPGREYLVLALQMWEGIPWVQLPSDSGYIMHVPLCLFSVTDDRGSRYWRIEVHPNGDLTLWPESFYREYYHDDLIEGVSEVVADYKRVRAEMESEWIESAVERHAH